MRDELQGRYVAQLKWKNIGAKPIRAVTVEVLSLDPAGRRIAEPVLYTYLRLNARRDAVFGSDKGITLPDREKRRKDAAREPSAITVRIAEVVFGDGSLWAEEGAMSPIPAQPTLRAELSDQELVRQYQIRFSPESRFVPRTERDLWLCSCGGVNHAREATCHSCGQSRDGQLQADYTILAEQRDERLALEQSRREELAHESEIALMKARVIWKNVLIALACLAVILGGVKAAETWVVPAVKYRTAIKLLASGEYEKAAERFLALEDYRDSALLAQQAQEKAEEAEKEAKAQEDNAAVEAEPSPERRAELAAAQIGHTVLWGRYEQDNNTANGKEDIEWLVLAREDDRVLIISRYALDCQPYNTSRESVTWETCSLRKWLNSDFLNTAFDATERPMIPAVTVSADKNPSYDTNPGSSTTDQVFLLSITEANKYFSSNAARKCAPTAYAIAQGAENKVDGKAACWWWLRSPGRDSDYAAIVYTVGSVFDVGFGVNVDLGAVRPAMWIQLGD